ncbi:MAG: dynamin family protein, partial [Ardenticatenaceae bacterium]
MSKAEFSIVSDLKRLGQLAEHFELAEATRWLDEGLSALAGHHFSVAVVGEFKRGKSTFINALLGQEILPAGIKPCSAAPLRVTYGESSSVKIIFKSQNGEPEREKEITFEDLADYVTKLTPEAEAMAATVKEAVVSYPAAYGQPQIDLIDTPGLNDDEAMSEVTWRVLRDVSAVIFIMIPEAPFSESEGEFLHDKLLLEDMHRVLFVVNAIDRLKSAAERERILAGIKTRIKNSVEERLQEEFGKGSDEYKRHRQRFGEPLVFGLSSYNALQAKVTHNRHLLAESGFPEFESALERFLIQLFDPLIGSEHSPLANAFRHASQQLLNHIDQQATIVQKWQQHLEMADDDQDHQNHQVGPQQQTVEQWYQHGKALDELWTEVHNIYYKRILPKAASLRGRLRTDFRF